MSLGVRYYTPSQFEITNTGAPGVGFQLFSYENETSTPLATYSDVNLTIANTNPIVADGNGRFGSIFLLPNQIYTIALYSAIPAGTSQSASTPASPLGLQIWSYNNCGPAASGVPANGSFIGQMMDFVGLASAIPSLWYLCYGQAVSRTTYAAAFAVMGTTWGAGDGSTTFNLPDFRGRVAAGIDNMGGTAANRITSGVSGISGVTLGATGGGQNAQSDTLTAVSTVTDTGHDHTFVRQGGSGSVSGPVSSWTGTSTPTVTTNSAVTGITVATTVTGSFTGTTQNVQPTGMVYKIVYLGA